MIEDLYQQLEDRGYKGRVVSVQRVSDLQEAIEGHHRAGLFDDEFYQEFTTWVAFALPDDLPRPSSVIVVSVPQPQVRSVFKREGESVPLTLAPTYAHWNQTGKQVQDLLMQSLGPHGYQVARARLPLKLLAVHSGLAAYGRNNLSYVAGSGSCHRLVGFYSDMPCDEDNWQALQLMEVCQKCSACLRSCPTGALSTERFLLRGERCITFHNEHSNDIPFPKWVDASWHNCLAGCLHCQRVCPENKNPLRWIESGPEFTDEETAMLLQGASMDQIPASTQEKLARFGIPDLLDILARNLGVLLGQRDDRRGAGP